MSPPVAIVTGAASGIGRALCGLLANRGAVVVVADIDISNAERVASEVGGGAIAFEVDVTDAHAVQTLIDWVFQEHGRLDWLFNNAGVGGAGLVDDLEVTDWRAVVDVNLWGVIHGVSAAYPRMVQQGFGHIVNTASGAGLAPRPGMTPYATTKAGVVGLSLSLRAEAAAHGVKVAVACPGFIDTQMLDRASYVGVDGRALKAAIPIRPTSAEACARAILRGVDGNRAVILDSRFVLLDWMLLRISPRLAVRVAAWRARQFRSARKTP